MSNEHSSTSVQVRYIDWCPGYAFRSDGAIWSKMRGTWQQLSPSMSDRGYRRVALRIDGKSKWFYVQRLILEAFNGPCPDGLEACHEDGNALNNAIDNLRWGTRTSNVADMIKHGVLHDINSTPREILRGDDHPTAKLTESQVVEIRTLYAEGVTQNELIARFGVTGPALSMVISGKRWKHAGGPILSKAERHAIAVRNRKYWVKESIANAGKPKRAGSWGVWINGLDLWLTTRTGKRRTFWTEQKATNVARQWASGVARPI